MKKAIALALFAVSTIALPLSANAAPCKDTKGKFIKCPPAASAPAKPTPKAATCKDAKGKFVKCPPAAAAPQASAAVKKAPCRDAKGRFKKC